MKYLHYKPNSNSSLHKVKRQKFCKNNILCCNAKGTREVIETEDMRLDLLNFIIANFCPLWEKNKNPAVILTLNSDFLQCPRSVLLRFAWRENKSIKHIIELLTIFLNFVGKLKADHNCSIPGCVKLGKKFLLLLQLCYQSLFQQHFHVCLVSQW